MKCEHCGKKKCKCGAVEYYTRLNETSGDIYISEIPYANTAAFAFMQLELRLKELREAIGKQVIGGLKCIH